MILPKYSWKRKVGETLSLPGVVKVVGNEGGLPNFDDGYFQGMPLGGIGAGTFSQSFRGDFSIWHLEIGKHIYKTIYPCQFGFYEDRKAFILNDYKPQDGSLSSWIWKKPDATYHALYPTAYFEYHDLNLILEQFSPIIPHNYKETSYPVAVFRWHISNPRAKERNISLLWSWQSFFGSKENNIYKGKDFSGLVFNNLDSNPPYKNGQMGIFVETQNAEVSFLNHFDGSSNGNEVWKTFSLDGTLNPRFSNLNPSKDMPGALAAKVKLKPNESKIITFVLVWDFPVLESGFGTKWYKHYTKFFGNDGKNVIKIAGEAFKNQSVWINEIKNWQEEYLKTDKPDWFKVLLINELYYLAHGGTLWIYNETAKDGHFGILECFDYPFYETLDVRFYGSFPLLKLWPDLEKKVMEDYCKTINLEDKEKVFFNHPLDQTTSERKIAGAVPHDLGAPWGDPFLKVNSYEHVNINLWKDLNSKFVLMIYRYFYFSGKKDINFLNKAWHSVVEAIKYLKQFDRDNDCLIENDNIPDQTYDNWVMHGASVYCNGLWLASLKAAVEIAKLLNKDYKLFQAWLDIGKMNLEAKLWSGDYYLFDTKSPHSKNIMADQLCGQWYADLLDLGDVFEKERVESVLKKLFNFNVKKIGDGKIGAINGINPDGSMLPESKVWKSNTQSNEIWTGVTLALASHMDLRGFKKEAMETAFGVYSIVYEKKGYWFRTPEAWDVNGNFRASMYHRPGVIWSFL